MRSVVALVIGLFAGVMLSVVAINTLRKGTAYPNGVMAVMSAQMGHLDRSLKSGACSSDDLAVPLATLMALGNDLEPAFLPTADDALFSALAADYRAAVEAAAERAPADCAQADATLDAIGATCTACHQQFKG